MSKAKICTQCGAPLNEGSNKCEYCGVFYENNSTAEDHQTQVESDRWMDAKEKELAIVVLIMVAAIFILAFVIAAKRGWK